MADSVVIRDLRWEDFRQVVKNFYGYYDELKTNPSLGILVGGKKPSMAHEVEWFAEEYKKMLSGDAVVCVAEVNGRVVGMCDVIKLSKPGIDHIAILGITITKKHRGKGIGTRLIKHCLKNSKGKFEIIELAAFAGNKSALNLYKKFGFKQYGLGKGFIKRGNKYIDEHFLSLKL